VKLLYWLIMNLATPFVAPFFLFKARGRARLLERFGIWGKLSDNKIFWFHAASVGEVNGILSLIRSCRKRFPDHDFLLTSTSVTGLKVAEAEVTHLRLLPFDGIIWIALATKNLDIERFFFGETELWPSLLTFFNRRRIPTHMINGVISDTTFNRYLTFRKLFCASLETLSTLSMSNQTSADRILALGATEDRIVVTGNTKYDRAPSIQSQEQIERLRKSLALKSAPTLVLASIHPPEFEPWLSGALSLLDGGIDFQVIIAPRHKEKLGFFLQKLRSSNIAFKTRSSQLEGGDSDNGYCPVLLLDTLGELEQIFSLTDLAFIGGTLCAVGGHNPLEAASYSNALCFGPETFKISELVADLKLKNACSVLNSSEEIRKLVQSWLQDPLKYKQQGQRAREVWLSHQGAADRVMHQIFAGD